MADGRITLRELAQNLLDYERYSRSVTKGRAELLRLLRDGKLKALFDFPSPERPSIPVPAAYWNDVTTGKFRKALDGNKASRGDYLVDPRIFAKQYLDWFLANQKIAKSVDELTAALRASGTMAEVYVLETDWETFVTAAGIGTREHSLGTRKSRRGRSPDANWPVILVEVAIELLNAPRDFRPNTADIALNVLKRVTPREGTVLLDVDTVGRKVDEIIHRSGTFASHSAKKDRPRE